MEDIKKTVDLAEEVAKENEEQQTEATEQKEEQVDKTQTFDYEKLAELVNGKQSVTEDSVLRGYFKQQGLTPDEMTQAIATFKEQKAQNTPDINAIQGEAQANLKRALTSEAQTKAMLMASELGVDVKAMPYLVRMANVEEVIGSGEVDEAKLRSSLEEIISAMPQLKQTAVQGGFQTVGVETRQDSTTDDDELYHIFGVKKK